MSTLKYISEKLLTNIGQKTYTTMFIAALFIIKSLETIQEGIDRRMSKLGSPQVEHYITDKTKLLSYVKHGVKITKRYSLTSFFCVLLLIGFILQSSFRFRQKLGR